jgi:hypothetical protein
MKYRVGWHVADVPVTSKVSGNGPTRLRSPPAASVRAARHFDASRPSDAGDSKSRSTNRAGFLAVLKIAAKAWYLAPCPHSPWSRSPCLPPRSPRVAGVPVNSRFGRFISRFAQKIPVYDATGIPGKTMIIQAVFRQVRRQIGRIAKIPGYFPGSREFAVRPSGRLA